MVFTETRCLEPSRIQSFDRLSPPDWTDHLDLIGAVPFHWNLVTGRMTTDVEHALAKLLKLPINSEPFTRTDVSAVFPSAVQTRRRILAHDLAWNGAQYALRYELDTLDGQSIWIEERGTRQSGRGATPHLIAGVLIDVSDTVTREQTARHSSRYDPLTGFLNADGFAQAVACDQRLNADASDAQVISVRIMNLETIERNFGFPATEYTVKFVAQKLEDQFDQRSVLGRPSDQVYTLLRRENSENAYAWISGLSAIPITTPFGLIKVDLNVKTELASNWINPFETASAALPSYPKAQSHPNPKFSAEDIRSVLQNERLTLAFQPIVDARTKNPVHYECLLRLITDTGDIVSAWPFIRAAEALSLIDVIDLCVLDMASEKLGEDPSLRLAVNLSAGTLRYPDKVQTYLDRLSKLGSAAQNLTIELTETLALECSDIANQFAAKARALGCKFAVDDFGAGHTSFRNLLNVEADIIKIDGAFVKNIATDQPKQAFVRLLVDFAQTLNLKTVAEMVDNAADAQYLTRVGVDYLQGYFFGMPGAIPKS